MLQKCGAATRIGGAILLSMGLAGARAEDGPRFPQPTMEQLTAEQQAVAAEVLKQSSAGLGGPYGILIKKPGALEALSVDDRLSAAEDIVAASAQ